MNIKRNNIRYYPHSTNSGILLLLVIIFALLLSTVSAARDCDGDGVDDAQDNCTEKANPDQRDSNADLDNNNSVSFAYLDLFKPAFGTNDADADFDGNGSVSFTDLDAFKMLFGKPPRPSGNGGRITNSDATRFLTQATFAPVIEDVQHLAGLANYDSWIENQFSLPASYHLPLVKARAPGGWDTHGNQLEDHTALLTKLDNAMDSFYQTTVELGVADSVTAFTASEFGRTLISNGDGTDHAWGTHSLVMGGNVDGGQIHGELPILEIGGPDDAEDDGRIIPNIRLINMELPWRNG